ncbi:hypothetical protein MSAN_00398900 [Mycena sanguinolenta]|uniref:Ubiquitin 3 binding protein But2 C-terminal domain-containing protein n=1 Tax=Mycena sanguinolenta TaxID=230812 RepID=A0A8H6ZGC9_9AGAR|nr:hypothetical protein MSAN_00398900 [Mycena sanguinolenta]
MIFNQSPPSSPSDSVDGEYAALLQDEDSTTKEASAPASGTPRVAFKLERLVRVATSIIVLCTVIDCMLLLYLGVQQHSAQRNAARDEEDLEIRSPYVNLAELYSQTSLKSSKHDPIVNHARAFVQISSTEPHRIFPPYGLLRPIADGMVPEYQRHLLVTPTISTIAQFRVADFGMENCSLSITVPPRADSNDHIHDEPATLDIWSYPVTKKLDMQKLSYATRPTGGTFFGSLPVSFGETYRLPGYHCLSGSYQTFEFKCSTPECKIDVMGNGDEASGLYVYQYQTI